MKVLVTGGTGFLGTVLVPTLVAAGHEVTVFTRQDRPSLPPGVRVAVGDLLDGSGLGAAVGGVDAVIHAASSAFRRTKATDIGGTELVIQHLRKLPQPPHLIYPSIVGIERHPLPYYQAKLAAEHRIAESGLPHTIMRATQFHVLMNFTFRKLLRFPMAPVVKGWQLQPVDESEVADRLSGLVVARPGGRVDDFAGPQILTVRQMAEEYATRHGRTIRLFGVPPIGGSLKAYSSGANTNPDADRGTISWSDWLATHP